MKRVHILSVLLLVQYLFCYDANAQTWQLKLKNNNFGTSRGVAITNIEGGYLYHGAEANEAFFGINEIGTITKVLPDVLTFPKFSSTVNQLEVHDNSYLVSSSPAKLSRVAVDGSLIWQQSLGTSAQPTGLVSQSFPAFLKDGNQYIFAGINSILLLNETTGSINTSYSLNGNYTCASISKDNDNYVILAEEINTSLSYIIIMATDGTIQSKTPLGIKGYDLQVVSNGYLVVGKNASDIMAIKKFDKEMIELWSRVYAAGTLHKIIPIPNAGAYIISGSNNATGQLLKIDYDGNSKWLRAYANISRPEGRTAVIRTNNLNGFIIATQTHLLRTDNNGEVHEPQTDLITSGAAVIDINNIHTMINADGALFWDKSHAYFRVKSFTYDINTIFAGGLWMGGFDDNNDMKFAAQTFGSNGSDYQSGFIGADAAEMKKVWKVRKSQIKKLRRDFDNDGSVDGFVPYDILTYPALGNPNAAGRSGQTLTISQDYVPFFDRNNDGIYNVYDGDYPIIDGDMQLVWFTNDNKAHTQSNGDRFEFDIVGTLYANECSGDGLVDNTLFLKFKGINQSNNTIDSFRLGMWSDVELGCAYDDYVGSIPALNSYYVYNADDLDGANAGCVGNPFGPSIPIQSATYLNHSLSSFIYTKSSGGGQPNLFPSTVTEYYNFLSGRWRDGTPITTGGDGTIPNNPPTAFAFSGNPANSSEWSMAADSVATADFRTLATTTLPSVAPNTEFTVEMAYITHENVPHPMPDILPIEQRITQVQGFYNNQDLNWDVYLGADKALTVGQPLILSATIEGGNPSGTYTYLWSTGETTSTINVATPINYTVTVTNTLTGCTKTDNVSVLFPTSTAVQNTVLDNVVVFPNPAQDAIQIDITQLETKKITINLVDVTGKTIKTIQNEYTDKIRFDVTDISQGVYFLSFMDSEMNKIGFKKVVILK